MPDQTFDDFIDPKKWSSFEEHFKSLDEKLGKDIEKIINGDKARKKDLREYLEKEYKIQKANDGLLKKAEKELLGGNVVASDGTYILIPLITGVKAQIGVVCTSYSGSKTEYACYFFEPYVKVKIKDIHKWLQESRKVDDENTAFSSSHIRAIMMFAERQRILERKEKWKITHGPLLPYELRTGQGRLKALPRCLELGKKMFTSKTTIGVLGKTTDLVLKILGTALKPKEFVRMWSFTKDLEDYLKSAHFNPKDNAKFELFIEETRDIIDVGLFKVKDRAYVFHAHKDSFEEAAAILIKDSLFQPMRGYPLLVDYADAICSHLVPSKDFKRNVEFKLAKKGMLEFQISERDLRRK